jgi:hypothetical protein
MGHNPYAPPAAAVTDAPPVAELERPRSVTIAFALLWGSILMGMPVAVWRVMTMGGVSPLTVLGIFLVVYGIVFALCFWLFGSLRKGKNWARITILVITALYVAMQPLALQITLSGPLPEAVVRISQLLLWIAAAVLLLTPASRAWYRALKAR